MATSEAETAVRNCLLYLEDPTQLIEQTEVERLEAAAQAATDPLERLHAVNRLGQIRTSDGEPYRQAFRDHAKAWAEANDIRPASFLAMGVDEATLRAAGFTTRTLGGPQRATRRSAAPSTRGMVRVEHIKAAIGQQTGQFTLADIGVAAGGSPMTIRKAVDELIAAGDVERLGPTPNWAQPGRAPIIYRLTAKRTRR